MALCAPSKFQTDWAWDLNQSCHVGASFSWAIHYHCATELTLLFFKTGSHHDVVILPQPLSWDRSGPPYWLSYGSHAAHARLRLSPAASAFSSSWDCRPIQIHMAFIPDWELNLRFQYGPSLWGIVSLLKCFVCIWINGNLVVLFTWTSSIKFTLNILNL